MISVGRVQSSPIKPGLRLGRVSFGEPLVQGCLKEGKKIQALSFLLENWNIFLSKFHPRSFCFSFYLYFKTHTHKRTLSLSLSLSLSFSFFQSTKDTQTHTKSSLMMSSLFHSLFVVFSAPIVCLDVYRLLLSFCFSLSFFVLQTLYVAPALPFKGYNAK